MGAHTGKAGLGAFSVFAEIPVVVAPLLLAGAACAGLAPRVLVRLGPGIGRRRQVFVQESGFLIGAAPCAARHDLED